MAMLVPFDPYTQSFTLLASDGTPFNVSIPDLDSFVFYNNQICINYGAQIGASIILLVVLLLLTKPDKRASSLFIVNVLSLALNVIRNVLQGVYFTGPFTETYAVFSGDFSRVHAGDYATSVTGVVLTLLVLICVEISLCLQTRVVCVTLRQLYRRIIFAASIVIALLAVGFRLALCIENSIYIIQANVDVPLQKLVKATAITETISICCFSAVFVTKLAFALNERRKLGLVQFGPMQIIFIMGCQTLIVPALFSLVQFAVNTPALYTNTLTCVVIFLPLSSLWASASLDSRFQASKEQHYGNKMISSGLSASAGRADVRNSNGPLSPADTNRTGASGSGVHSPHNAGQGQALRDLEAQGMVETDLFGNQ
ncbi:mating-type alpha-pheromone receptor PreB [Usnea florida]